MYFRTAPLKTDGTCNICGAEPMTMANPFPEHSSGVHEVYALEHWGMHSVVFQARSQVQGWADGTVPLPTKQEWLDLTESFSEAAHQFLLRTGTRDYAEVVF